METLSTLIGVGVGGTLGQRPSAAHFSVKFNHGSKICHGADC
jgi:hypothetical protein